jgi:hypothetical protein
MRKCVNSWVSVLVLESMTEWVSGWVSERVSERVSEWVSDCIFERLVEKVNAWDTEWLGEWLAQQTLDWAAYAEDGNWGAERNIEWNTGNKLFSECLIDYLSDREFDLQREKETAMEQLKHWVHIGKGSAWLIVSEWVKIWIFNSTCNTHNIKYTYMFVLQET